MTPAISVERLHKSYGAYEALRGVDFEIASGEVFGLLGPNGAGKTTTVEILEGYRTRDSGSVAVLGEYVTLDAGTGAVHTAPGHGADDFNTGMRYGLEIYAPVGPAGKHVTSPGFRATSPTGVRTVAVPLITISHSSSVHSK